MVIVHSPHSCSSFGMASVCLRPQSRQVLVFRPWEAQDACVVMTQSPQLLSHFSIGDIIVAKRKDGGSTYERLDEKDFKDWLDDYSVGELWQKNVIQGGSANE